MHMIRLARSELSIGVDINSSLVNEYTIPQYSKYTSKLTHLRGFALPGRCWPPGPAAVQERTWGLRRLLPASEWTRRTRDCPAGRHSRLSHLTAAVGRLCCDEVSEVSLSLIGLAKML